MTSLCMSFKVCVSDQVGTNFFILLRGTNRPQNVVVINVLYYNIETVLQLGVL